ncbi:MAG: transcriptional repressor [Bacteroidales bacterium]|nr:transcriptional repressor [Bacteroidales bacterium]
MENKIIKAKDIDQFKTALRRYSMKATPQRVAVHEAMLKLGHASADMVCEEIAKDGVTKITVASVYNVLDLLAGIGIYRRRMSSNNKMYFDVNTVRHMHIYDRENNVYKDIFDDELMEMIAAHLEKRKFRGYHIEDIDIQLVCRPTRRNLSYKNPNKSEK